MRLRICISMQVCACVYLYVCGAKADMCVWTGHKLHWFLRFWHDSALRAVRTWNRIRAQKNVSGPGLGRVISVRLTSPRTASQRIVVSPVVSVSDIFSENPATRCIRFLCPHDARPCKMHMYMWACVSMQVYACNRRHLRIDFGSSLSFILFNQARWRRMRCASDRRSIDRCIKYGKAHCYSQKGLQSNETYNIGLKRTRLSIQYRFNSC